ncbi:MAG: TonB-dependent receptor [bacterium]
MKSKGKIGLVLLIWAACLAFVHPSFSQENAGIMVEPVVITASRSPSLLKDVPANVSVVEKEAIKKSHSRTIDEALAREVGSVDVDSPGFSQTRTRQVTLRGGGDQSRTLVLLDGVPVQDNVQGWANWNLVNLDSIDRVEVVPGPVSSLYGSGGMGGVINIVTRVPELSSETSAAVSYGSLNSKSLDLFQGGKSGRFSYSVAGRAYHTDGYVAEKTPAGFNVKRARNAQNVFSKLVFRPEDDSSLTAAIAYGHEKVIRGRQFSNFDLTDILGYAAYAKKSGNIDFLARVNALYNFVELEKDKPPTRAFLDSVEGIRMVTLGGSMQADNQTEKWGKIALGVDGKFSTLESNGEYKTSVRSLKATGRQTALSPFLRDEVRFLDGKLIATLGGRLDWFRTYNGSELDTLTTKASYSANEHYAFSPSAGLVWRLNDKTSLRTAAGKAFQISPIAFLYRTSLNPDFGTINPNPKMKPETVWSYEAGADWKPVSALLARLTLYYTQGTDFTSVRIITPGTLAQYDNVASVQTRGAEAKLRWKLASEWSSSLTYTYNRARITADAVSTNVGHDFLNSPRSKFAWGMDYDNPKIFAATSRLRYKDKMFADIENKIPARAYWTMDVGISRKIGKLEARLDIENLFNRHYDVLDLKIPTALTDPGRLVSGSLRLAF